MRVTNPMQIPERILVGGYVASGRAASVRIEKAAFSDPAARCILDAVERIEGRAGTVGATTVQAELAKMPSLPCELGELASIVYDPEATSQPETVIVDLEREVHEAFRRREMERDLHRGLKALKEGADPESILSNLGSHHLPGFGSLGSSDPEPIRADPFPIGSLPPVCARIVREIARVAMVPVSLAAACVIGVVSTAIGAGLRIRNYRGTTGANLFIMPVASSGTGKDSALNLAAKPLYEIEAELLDRWDSEVRPDLAAQLRRVRAKLAAAEKRKTSDFESEVNLREEISLLEREKADLERRIEARPDLIVGDCTKEALGVAMAAKANEAIAGISSEARGILGTLQGRYSKGSDEDFFAGGFSGTPLKVTRIGRPTVRLRQPCLTLLWMVQPDAFRKLVANPEMVESGFVPRFLVFDSMVEPEDVPEQSSEMNPEIEAEWRNLIQYLVETFHDAPEPLVVESTPEASEVLREFDNRIRGERRSGGSLADIGAFGARWPEIAWRLALCLHTAFYGPRAVDVPLSGKHAENTREVMVWFVNEALNSLAGLREERRRDRKESLRRLLEGAEGSYVSLRDLKKSHGFDPAEVEAFAAEEKWLQIRAVQNERGGPRSKIAVFKREHP